METKSALASKGVWGSIIAIVAVAMPTILRLAGLEDDIAPAEATDLISQVVAAVGAAFALYGRITATKTIA